MIVIEIIILLFIFLIIFSLLIGFLGNPFVPTPQRIVKLMVANAGIKDGDIVYDLGSGDGRMLIEAVKKYDIKALGFEYSPLFFFISLFRRLFVRNRKRLKFTLKSFFHSDLSQANVVFCYILPSFMGKLKDKFEKELKSGTIIVSYTFQIVGWDPIQVIDTGSKDRPVYVYKKK